MPVPGVRSLTLGLALPPRELPEFPMTDPDVPPSGPTAPGELIEGGADTPPAAEVGAPMPLYWAWAIPDPAITPAANSTVAMVALTARLPSARLPVASIGGET